jgi:hypothetical protein
LVGSVSVLKPDEEDLHYSDGSHRWMCPDLTADEDAWADRVEAHVEAHGYRRDTPGPLIIRKAPRHGNQRR